VVTGRPNVYSLCVKRSTLARESRSTELPVWTRYQKPEQHMKSIFRASLWAAPFLLVALATAGGAEEAQAQRRVAPESLRHIQEVDPLHGPVGTEVTLYTENLPLQARVHVGVGATRTGFESVFDAKQQMFGEVSATITIPDTAPWDRAVVLIVFDAVFAPIGISDPFHVIGPTGVLRRTGEITQEGVECLAMRDTDGYLYTLIGETDELSPGDRVVIEATYVETSICMQGTTVRVARIVSSSQ
jgi:hypothetical protein